MAGVVVGFVVNGVVNRLAMLLLARLNPQVTGITSDDGFIMGRFTFADTASLVLVGTVIGVLGGLLFLSIRHLRFGPTWFRTASMTIGPAVVVGSMLVHTDGIDFHLLEPTWLAIALFLVLPGLFAYAVGLLVDRWTLDDAWPMRSRRIWIVGLVPVAALGPFAALVVAGLILRGVRHEVPTVQNLLAQPAWANLVRLGFVAVFLLALRGLTADVTTLL